MTQPVRAVSILYMSTPDSPPDVSAAGGPRKFGTFTGVFLPTLLTILGVIMYVRVGWVVGNAGLGGAMAILGLGILITACTGLSLSSIATNTRIGAGGPYAIMNKSLGLEVGGSIGIPLYLTRPLGVAMYIFGFREGLTWIYPEIPTLLADLGIFALLFGIAFKSADLAFKTQYVILGFIAVSLVSIFASPVAWQQPVEIEWFGSYPGTPEGGFEGSNFWMVFAVFFPATTGILAGANMSGDLEDPRRAIPVGTLWAIGISSVVYFAVAVWCARTGTLEELSGNYNHIIDNSLFPPAVLAGLLGATASSALAGLVGGPRILMAMGEQRVVPMSDRLAELKNGEPRTAMLVTGVLTIGCIMLRDLNAIAPLVTMFFLITYCMINVVVLAEGGLGLVSYRPTLKVPLAVPFIGLVGCLFSMFIINPTFSLISLSVVVGLFFFIRHRTKDREQTKEDVRSSFFTAFAEWAAGRITPDDLDNVRAWKPHLLLPTEDAEEARGAFPLLLDLAAPEGSVNFLGIPSRAPRAELAARLEELSNGFREHGVLSSHATVRDTAYRPAVTTSLDALQSAFFRPNLLFSLVPADPADHPDKIAVVMAAMEARVGVLLYRVHPLAGLGRKEDIHLFVRCPPSLDPDDGFASGNLNLVLLMGFRLSRIWKGALRLITVVDGTVDHEAARAYLDLLCDLARLPPSVERVVVAGTLESAVRELPVADLCILGIQRAAPDLAWVERTVLVMRSSCLFVLDSGRESARA